MSWKKIDAPRVSSIERKPQKKEAGSGKGLVLLAEKKEGKKEKGSRFG